MLPVAIFLFEILLLFLLSKLLTRTISNTLYSITRNRKLVIVFYSILFFPGTLIHEMSHFFMATILLVRTGKIRLFPYNINGEIHLGSVAIAKTDPIRRLLIGTAPIIVGTSIILVSVLYLASAMTFSLPLQFDSETVLSVFFLLYILFVTGNTMFASKRDMEGATEILLAFLLLFLSLYFLGIRIPAEFVDHFPRQAIVDGIKKADFFLTFPLTLDLLLYLVLKIANYLTLR